MMPELSLFRFSAIFITEPLTKTLLATRRPPAGLPAAGSAQGGEAQGRAKARTLTGQDGHFHVAVGHQAPRHPGIPRQGSRKDPRAEPEDKTLVDSLGHRWGTRPCGQTAGPTVGREVPCHSTGEQTHQALVCRPPPWLMEEYGDPVFLSFPPLLVFSA